jgi:tetratricopeptide (TPR) repeat protein
VKLHSEGWHVRLVQKTPRTRDKHPSADDLLARGLASAKQGQLLRAVVEFSAVIRLSPAFARPYNGRAAVYNSLMEYEKALADASEAIRLDPAYVTAYLTRAYTSQRRGQFDQAIADYTEALRLEPSLAADIYFNRAAMYLLKGEIDSALADLGHASRLNPSISMPSPELRCAEMLLGLGQSELVLHHDVLAQLKALAPGQTDNQSERTNAQEWELIRMEPVEPCEPPAVAPLRPSGIASAGTFVVERQR